MIMMMYYSWIQTQLHIQTKERIKEIGIGNDRARVRLDGLIPPPKSEELSVMDAKKILKVSQLETVKARMREVESDCVTYKEFVEICSKDCSSVDEGLEFAKMLDQSASVIVLQNSVHLKPEKITNVDGKQKIMFALTSINGIGRRFDNILV